MNENRPNLFLLSSSYVPDKRAGGRLSPNADQYVIYGAEWDEWTRLSIAVMKVRGLNYSFIDVLKNPEAYKAVKEATRRNTLPQIFLNSKLLGGYQELAKMHDINTHLNSWQDV